MQNNNIFLTAKAAVAALCAAFTAAFGWLGWLVLAWAACMVADWVSGSAAAAKSGTWSSEKARAGIWHKAGMIFVVFAAGMTDALLAVLAVGIPGLDGVPAGLLLPVVLAWYVLTELGSIAENAALLGAPVPAWLTRVLAVGRTLVEQNAPHLPGDDE